MIAYLKKDLDHTYLVAEAESLLEAGFIEKPQFVGIKTKFAVLKENKNWLLRLVFVFLGVLAYASICGFLAVMFFVGSQNIDSALSFYCILCAVVGFAATEILIKNKHFGHGLDDAFLIGAQIALLFFVFNATQENELAISLVAVIITLLSFLRYLHVPTALMFGVSCVYLIGFTSFEFGQWGKTLLPFTMMLAAGVGFVLSKKYLENTTEHYYKNGTLVFNSFCLIWFYMSGNYLVVRQLSEALLQTEVQPGQDIPFAYLFYAFTFLVPAIYVYYALIKKDRILLWIGLGTFCFAIYTFRYYHHVLPTEIALTLGGAVIFGVVYFLIKKLEKNTTGITFIADKFDNSERLANLETLISASQTNIKIQESGNVQFGGGTAGGGGSGADF
jgi:hypothetical protein